MDSAGDNMLVDLGLGMGAAGDGALNGTTVCSFSIMCLNPSASLEHLQKEKKEHCSYGVLKSYTRGGGERWRRKA